MNIVLRSILVVTLLFIANHTHAGPYYQSGVIFDHTSIAAGLLIRFNPTLTALPDNCVGTTLILIPEANKTMIATTLLAIAKENRTITVYTSGVVGGFCIATQLDPAN
jgi:hypothetical protein